MTLTGSDLFIAALLVGYLYARWRLYRHLLAKRRAR